jgi:hypothetical protein
MEFEEWVKVLPADVLREFAGGNWRMREVPRYRVLAVVLRDHEALALARESHRLEREALDHVAALDPWVYRNLLVRFPFLAGNQTVL